MQPNKASSRAGRHLAFYLVAAASLPLGGRAATLRFAAPSSSSRLGVAAAASAAPASDGAGGAEVAEVGGGNAEAGAEVLTSLTSGGACAPPPEKLSALAASKRASGGSDGASIKFFLHDKNAFDFTEVVQCFLDKYEAKLTNDDFDDRMETDVAEHLGELFLLERLRVHPLRTLLPEEAKLHIIGSPTYVSYAAAWTGQCGEYEDHERRMVALKHAIQSLPFFKEFGGPSFFLAMTHFRLSDIFGQEFFDFLELNHVVVGTEDSFYGGFFNEGWNKHTGIRKVTLPYKAHYLSEASNARWAASRSLALLQSDVAVQPRPQSETKPDAQPEVKPEVQTRSKNFFFHGCMHRSKRKEGSKRPILLDFRNKLSAADIDEVCMVGQFAKLTNLANASLKDISISTAQSYSDARFCFVPAGDSPTSRRLFDALASGCVPVYFGDFDRMQPNLPFNSMIDWTKLMLFAGDFNCTTDNIDHVAEWLGGLAETSSVGGWKRMSQLGQEAFHQFLSYREDGSLVDALLQEVYAASLMAEADKQAAELMRLRLAAERLTAEEFADEYAEALQEAAAKNVTSKFGSALLDAAEDQIAAVEKAASAASANA